MKRFILTCSIILMLVLFPGCSPEQADDTREQEKVSLQLKWHHSAQFAGCYFAKENGYFADEQLDVRLIEGGPEIDQVEQLIAGTADFALVPAESLFLKNDHQDPIVAIAVIYQRSPLVFAVKENSDIFHPEDFPGKTIAVGNLDAGGFLEGIIQFNALMELRNIDTSSINRVPYDWSFKGFIDGTVDITPTYMTSGAIKLQHNGVSTRLIWPGDYGLEFYADTLVTRASYINNHPDIVQRFVNAFIRGWLDAIAYPNKAVEYTLKYAEEKNEEWQMDIMNAQMALIYTGTSPIGTMQRTSWSAMHDILLQQGLIEAPIENIDTLFTPIFVERVHAKSIQ